MDASDVSDEPPADEPPTDDDAMMDAFFGPPDEDQPEGETAAEGEPPEGETPATETIVSGPEVAPAEELDLSDIFGDDESVEVPEITEAPPDDPQRRSGAGLLNGKLDFRARIVSSVYIDVDNSFQGKRWNKQQPSLADFSQPPSVFKKGVAIPRGTVSRNENRLEFYLSYTPNEHIQVVADIEPVFLGVSQVSGLQDLSSMQLLAPFHIESDAAYVAINDALPGLDIKIGRQIVVWGTADKFNPTNNINADDLEDRPLFTEPIANQMLTVDFSPWQDKLWFQGVYVPLFYPALLPPSASQALADPQTPVNFANQSDRDKMAFLQGFVLANDQFYPSVSTRVERPPVNITNGQAAAKIGSRIGPVDLSASYYYGFHDIPIPYEAISTQRGPLDEAAVNGFWYDSKVTLVYPRMHVAGLDFAAQLPFLDDMGLWGEAALIIPQKQYDFRVELPINLDVTPKDGIANPIREFQGAIVERRPFIKATAGADYTIGKHWYIQAQYLRGFIDDFGAGNIGNYLVAGSDLVFFGRHLIFRFFAVTDFPRNRSDRASVVLAPNIIMVPPWGYATLELGGFAFIGRNDTKFGQSATGSSIAYLKITGSF
ncbi:hypothetical protein ACNOYE_17990 [Nannocystaceae bacterium ST9]